MESSPTFMGSNGNKWYSTAITAFKGCTLEATKHCQRAELGHEWSIKCAYVVQDYKACSICPDKCAWCAAAGTNTNKIEIFVYCRASVSKCTGARLAAGSCTGPRMMISDWTGSLGRFPWIHSLGEEHSTRSGCDSLALRRAVDKADFIRKERKHGQVFVFDAILAYDVCSALGETVARLWRWRVVSLSHSHSIINRYLVICMLHSFCH